MLKRKPNSLNYTCVQEPPNQFFFDLGKKQGGAGPGRGRKRHQDGDGPGQDRRQPQGQAKQPRHHRESLSKLFFAMLTVMEI